MIGHTSNKNQDDRHDNPLTCADRQRLRLFTRMHSFDEAERVHYLVRDGSDMGLVCKWGFEYHYDKLRALDIQVFERDTNGKRILGWNLRSDQRGSTGFE